MPSGINSRDIQRGNKSLDGLSIRQGGVMYHGSHTIGGNDACDVTASALL